MEGAGHLQLGLLSPRTGMLTFVGLEKPQGQIERKPPATLGQTHCFHFHPKSEGNQGECCPPLQIAWRTLQAKSEHAHTHAHTRTRVHVHTCAYIHMHTHADMRILASLGSVRPCSLAQHVTCSNSSREWSLRPLSLFTKSPGSGSQAQLGAQVPGRGVCWLPPISVLHLAPARQCTAQSRQQCFQQTPKHLFFLLSKNKLIVTAKP